MGGSRLLEDKISTSDASVDKDRIGTSEKDHWTEILGNSLVAITRIVQPKLVPTKMKNLRNMIIKFIYLFPCSLPHGLVILC